MVSTSRADNVPQTEPRYLTTNNNTVKDESSVDIYVSLQYKYIDVRIDIWGWADSPKPA
jgi:hypothetical protein